MTWRDPKDLRDAVAPPARDLLGRFRRMVVKLTSRQGASSAIWQLLGHRDESGRTETVDVETFQGVGVFARPKSGGKAEAIVVNVGGVEQPIAVAVRNEDVRRAIAQLAEDETAIFTSKAIVVIRADGTVEIRSAGGVGKALAFQEDLKTLRDHVDTLFTGGSGSAVVPAPAISAGTTVLKAE